MNSGILIFIISFTVGLVWNRILFVVVPDYFKKPFFRSAIKLRWHHLHMGVVLITVGTISLLLSNGNILTNILLGTGLGLVIDLFIPSLKLETNREDELIIYRNSLVPTLFLGALIVAVIVVLAF
jgi:hypothetical protein